jgi:hypothetical protein
MAVGLCRKVGETKLFEQKPRSVSVRWKDG